MIHPTQLLVAALLAIHFGKPGERDTWDTAVGAELLLRILDALDITGGQGGDSLLQLLIRRYGENRNEQERYLLGRYFDLFVQRPRAKWGSRARSTSSSSGARATAWTSSSPAGTRSSASS